MKKTWPVLGLTALLSSGVLLAPPAQAQLFGESDEVKAARQAHEDGQDAQINQLKNRVQQLEDKARSLTDSLSQATGATEDLSHRLVQMEEKLDRAQKDFSYRLCMISAQQLGADASDQGLNCASAASGAPPPGASVQSRGFTPGASLPPVGSSYAPAPQAYSAPQGSFGGPPGNGAPSALMGSGSSTIDASGAPQRLGRPSGTLGTLDSSSSGPRVAAAPPRASGSSTGFDTAMNLLAKAQYDEAKAGFRAYADANPQDSDLSSQAVYWVGDINYVQRDYPNAARAFAEQIKKYPGSSRGPDSMLKLGQSLLAMGQTNEGCTTLGALKSKYPKASASTLAAAAAARKTGCR